jgi:glycosyltransferase involved in cell wall biosynthesis
MAIDTPKISICIPAYNRPHELRELLESIQIQEHKPYEVIICEDNSPDRLEIAKVIDTFEQKTDLDIKYYENEKNLGYDANLRRVISLAKGDYIFLSGNDDILSKDSLKVVADKISTYSPDIIIRSYASFYKDSSNKRTEHRYVISDYYVKKSDEELAWLFYRSVLVSGLVFKAKPAQLMQSDLVDGTLYYQNYLLTKIFQNGTVLYIPDILVYNRIVDAGDFGSSEIEAKGAWEPGKRTIESSLYQMKMFFECAKQVELECTIKFLDHLKIIASAYSYPLIAYHADKSSLEYFRYIRALQKIGYGGVFFYFYAACLKILGVKLSNILLAKVRKIFGYTKRIV